MTQEIRKLVRVANTDVMGDKTLLYGLAKIHGIGLGFSGAICEVLNLDKSSQIGALDKGTIENIENTIADPQSKNIPSWLYNRKFDIESGKDIHLIGPKLKLTQEFDLRRMKKIKSYKGIRHMFNLPVRGQRTKGNFRKGKSVGVVRKKR
tara:strand:- start:3994 stop:4443 length:450 start_codon:yes stop_codon:yes gene_type:complete